MINKTIQTTIKSRWIDLIPSDLLFKLKTLKYTHHIPTIINGNEYNSNNLNNNCHVIPHNKNIVLTKSYNINKTNIRHSINTLNKNNLNLTNNELRNIFEKAINLIQNTYRLDLIAATMLGQGKTYYQAELDSIHQTVNYLNSNLNILDKMFTKNSINTTSTYKPLNGHILSITSFNSSSNSSNLASMPLLLNNNVLWNPSSKSLLSNYLFYKIMLEAGYPPSKFYFIPETNPNKILKESIKSKELSGLIYDGAATNFKNILNNMYKTKEPPKIISEIKTNNRNFLWVNPDYTNFDWVAICAIRGAFEYSGQLNSSTNTLFLPKSNAYKIIDTIVDKLWAYEMGNPENSLIFTGAMIDKESHVINKKIIKKYGFTSTSRVIYGGESNDTTGYFVEPTLIESTVPNHILMTNEIFSPILTYYIYDDSNNINNEIMKCIPKSNDNIIGSIFTNNLNNNLLEMFYKRANQIYINDKTTGIDDNISYNNSEFLYKLSNKITIQNRSFIKDTSRFSKFPIRYKYF